VAIQMSAASAGGPPSGGGGGGGVAAVPSATPELGSMLLLASGLVPFGAYGLSRIRRRRSD
jgi:hypothetical protein